MLWRQQRASYIMARERRHPLLGFVVGIAPLLFLLITLTNGANRLTVAQSTTSFIPPTTSLLPPTTTPQPTLPPGIWAGLATVSCPSNRGPIGVVRSAGGGDFERSPFNCSTFQTFTGSGDTQQSCVNFGQDFQCNVGYTVRSLCIPNATISCPCPEITVVCEKGLSPPVASEACEWRTFGTSPTAFCQDDETMSGFCLSDWGTRACSQNNLQSRVVCCHASNQPCSPAPQWQKSQQECAYGSGVVGVCSYGCDPTDSVGAITGGAAAQSLVLCHGSFFTRKAVEWRSSCTVGFVSCPSNHIVTQVTHCGGAGNGVSIRCRPVRWGALLDRKCVQVGAPAGESAYCPSGYATWGVCANSGPSACSGGVPTNITCCPYRMYYHQGIPCRMGYVYSVLGLNSARNIPYGLNSAPIGGVALRLTSDFTPFRDSGVCQVCTRIQDTALDSTGFNMYALLSTFDPNTGDSTSFMVQIPLAGLDPRVRMIAGSTTDSRVPANEWTGYNATTATWPDIKDMSMAFAYGASVGPGLEDGILTVTESTYVREIDFRSSPSTAWIVTGKDPNFDPFVNDVPSQSARFPSRIMATRYRRSLNELFLTTYSFIARSKVGRMISFCGDPQIPLSAAADAYLTGASRSCTTQRLGSAGMMFMDPSEKFMYYTDGTTTHGGLIYLDLIAATTRKLNIQPTIERPFGFTIYNPLNGDPPKFFMTGPGHAIYQVDSVSLVSTLLGGSFAINGYQDYVTLANARFNSPQNLLATPNQLFVTDRDNGLIRAITLDPCSFEFNSSTQCQSCNEGFYHYPRCRDVCTVEDDCINRATSVGGTQPSSCVCVCIEPFRGNYCRGCARGYDPSYACQTCAPGFVGKYPACRTKTMSFTTTKSRTVKLTNTRTLIVPGTPTVRLTPSPTMSLTWDATWTKSWTRTPPPTATVIPTPTGSEDKTMSRTFSRRPRPIARKGGVYKNINGIDEWKFFTFTVTPSISANTATVSMSATIKRKRRRQPWDHRPGNGDFYTNSLTLSRNTYTLSVGTASTFTLTTSRVLKPTRSQTPTITPAPTATRTREKTRTRVIRTLPNISFIFTTRPTTTGTTATIPTPPPTTGVPTTRMLTAPPTTPSTTPEPTDPPETEEPAPTTPAPETDPPKPDGDQTLQVLSTGLTYVALSTGDPLPERQVVVTLSNGYWNPRVCKQPNMLSFSGPPKTDVSFLADYSSWCNYTHLIVTFSVATRMTIENDPQVSMDVSRVMLYAANATAMKAPFVIVTPKISKTAETAQTAATATTTVISVAGGGAGATQIQGLALAGAVSCADSSVKGTMSSARSSISPWKAIDNDEVGYMLGNFVIMVGGCALVCAATGGFFFKTKRDIDNGVPPDVEEFPDPLQDPKDLTDPKQKAHVKVGFPGRLYVFVALTLQGICFESHLLLHTEGVSIGGRIVGAIGLLYCLALPVVGGYFVRTQMGPAKQCTYKYAPATFPVVIRPLLPSAFWAPQGFAARYGALFKSVRRRDVYFCIFDPFVKLNLTSAIAAFQVSKGTPCQVQYALLVSVYVFEAVYRIVRWPNISPVDNISPVVAAVSTAVVAASAGFNYSLLSTELAMLVQSYISMVCEAVTLGLSIFEDRVMRPRELKGRYEANDFDFTELGAEAEAAKRAQKEKEAKEAEEAKKKAVEEANEKKRQAQLSMVVAGSGLHVPLLLGEATEGSESPSPGRPGRVTRHNKTLGGGGGEEVLVAPVEIIQPKAQPPTTTLSLLLALKKEQDSVAAPVVAFGGGSGNPAATLQTPPATVRNARRRPDD